MNSHQELILRLGIDLHSSLPMIATNVSSKKLGAKWGMGETLFVHNKTFRYIPELTIVQHTFGPGYLEWMRNKICARCCQTALDCICCDVSTLAEFRGYRSRTFGKMLLDHITGSKSLLCKVCQSGFSSCRCSIDELISCYNKVKERKNKKVFTFSDLSRLFPPDLEVITTCPVCHVNQFDCQCGNTPMTPVNSPFERDSTKRKPGHKARAIENYHVHRKYLKPAKTYIAQSERSYVERVTANTKEQLLQSIIGQDGFKEALRPQVLLFAGEANATLRSFVSEYIYKLMSSNDGFEDKIKSRLEDFIIFVGNLSQATSATQILFTVAAYIKTWKQGSLIGHASNFLDDKFFSLFPQEWWESMFNTDNTYTVQGGLLDDFAEWASFSRNLFENFENIRESRIFSKLSSFFIHCFANEIFIGGDLEKFVSMFTEINAEAAKSVKTSRKHFVHAFVDLATFMLDRGFQCVKLGSIVPLTHSSASYDAWLLRVSDIIAQAPFVTNPEPHGFTLPEFLGNLNAAIEEGESIYKLAKASKTHEVKFLYSKLGQLKHIKANALSKKAAMKNRKAPLGFLLNGTTSIGKSNFSYIMYIAYAKLFGLPYDDEYRYIRNSIDQYWVNFNSQQWAIILDDIAAFHPDIMKSSGDPTLLELLQVINNVPFIPIQADIDDKGKTPMLAELVIATTNTMHLNLKTYFSCPEAVARRLPYVITIVPKDCYKTEDGRLDGSKLPAVEADTFPDYWNIQIHTVVTNPNKGANDSRSTVLYKEIENFTDINDFIKWYGKVCTAYRTQQAKLTKSEQVIKDVLFCDTCKIPRGSCECMFDIIELEINEEYVPQVDHQYPTVTEDIVPFFCEQACELRADVVERMTNERVKAVNESLRAVAKAKTLPITWWWIYLIRLFIFMWLGCGNWTIILCYIMPAELCISLFFSSAAVDTTERIIMQRLGDKISKRLGHPKSYLKVAGALAAGGAATYILSRLANMYVSDRRNKKQQAEIKRRDAEIEETYHYDKIAQLTSEVEMLRLQRERDVLSRKDTSYLTTESKITERMPISLGEDEPVNIYKNEKFVTMDFDVSRLTQSWKGMDRGLMLARIAKNVVNIQTTYQGSKGEAPLTYTYCNALCLSGNLYVTNNHSMPPDSERFTAIEHKLVSSNMPNQPNLNVKFKLRDSKTLRLPERDLVFFEILSICPKANIIDLLPEKGFKDIIRGTLVHRAIDGTINYNEAVRGFGVRNSPHEISADTMMSSQPQLFSGDTYSVLYQNMTKNGECGAPLVGSHPMGPIILGIHFLGSLVDNTAFATCVYKSDVEFAIASIHPLDIEADEPQLSTQSKSVELVGLHPKSPFRFVSSGHAAVFASINNYQRRKFKSRVNPTPLCTLMMQDGWQLEHGKPNHKGWDTIHTILDPMLQCSNDLDFNILDKCKEAFLKDIFDQLPEGWEKLVHPVNNFTAVNGAAKVSYVDAINRSTSAGFPYNKSKKHFFEFVDPMYGLEHPVEFNEEIMQQVADIEARYVSGRRYMPVFKGNLKDEPLSHKKRKAGKIRLFAVSPVAFTIVVRKYYIMLCRLMMLYRDIFEHAVGINAASVEWGDMLKKMTNNFDPELMERFIAGDFEAFDKSMIAAIIIMSFEILIAIAERSGQFDASDILIMRGIAVDTSFGLVDFFGELCMFVGVNPSGHPLTVFINSLANSLYMRYAYYMANPDEEVASFQKNVKLRTFGDDNFMTVSPEIEWFDHTVIQDELGAAGIKYTMAEKEAESVPFIPLKDVTFLKRSFVFSEEVGAWLAPLDKKSISKMLMMHVQSKSDCVEHQTISAVSSATREFFMYGSVEFQEKAKYLRNLVERAGLSVWIEDATFPTWDELRNKFHDNSLAFY